MKGSAFGPWSAWSMSTISEKLVVFESPTPCQTKGESTLKDCSCALILTVANSDRSSKVRVTLGVGEALMPKLGPACEFTTERR